MTENTNITYERPSPLVSVLMPVYNQAIFISRALESLKKQSYLNWELIIVNDGSTDALEQLLEEYKKEIVFKYAKNETNKGLGYSLNKAMDLASGEYIAYLPADDVYYPDHLEELVRTVSSQETTLAYSSRYINTFMREPETDTYIHLVQAMHKKTDEKWVERKELVTDDLYLMLWDKLGDRSSFAGTGKVTCEWIEHPKQRHRIIREQGGGGLNRYRQHYRVQEPVMFHSTTGSLHNEVELYKDLGTKEYPQPGPDSLRILLVGELAFNPERILAFKERGHTLFGLWMRDPIWFNSVGPLPFGHVEDLDPDKWEEEIRRVRPDVIYALLNAVAVPLAYEVKIAFPEIPMAWHLKESPFACIGDGMWEKAYHLYTHSEGIVHNTPEIGEWLDTVLPPGSIRNSLVLDGDLPKKEWFDKPLNLKLSETDGHIHTVITGRPMGLYPEDIAEMSKQNIHFHFYGEVTQLSWKNWVKKAGELAPQHFHLHSNVQQNRWAEELSKYDAGWLHYFDSHNNGNIRKAQWDDLNYPARIGTYMCAGIPMLQKDNSGHIVSAQNLANEKNIGIPVSSIKTLGNKLYDKELLKRTGESIKKERYNFTFDAHTDRLIDFFREVMR
jgi:hypothetical protein